ncbi:MULTISPECIES: LytTR family DNA-binding domain-containing protein [unclassified Pseudodesulfovibrio]|uniref:LytR/AlgR family response regulator transcription factor n=1 Tax=unclassified Pseudodesulfovibrio TaxID=2661612 RepID=UPI000FEB5F4C|nr:MULTISPECIES: LytTR family DNA-binding domain-containing protein [unclassified Pseudodesulfovibrio]MCJ2164812.1 LytTR family DNA-binding domain-containing protein [Pseudodesulfovibrio sp. S3-i]RWU03853.1 DNA-binding response regulator [Pseudodesulfovibrio sp. S3]
MQIRTLIVDDEAPARSELAYLLASYPDLEIQETQTAGEALTTIRNDRPDLVFLDIQMPGMDGFDVLREARYLPEPPLFIFVTAYDQYAVRAFEKNAVDYLLKPVSSERLKKSVERVREILGRQEKAADAQPELGDLLKTVAGDRPLPRFTVERGGRIQFIDFENIIYFELHDRKILVNTRDASIPCHGLTSLDEVEARVASQPFLRINRSTVVNLNRIREFTPWTGGKYCLILDDDGSTEVTLSRSRVREFKKRIGL